MAFGFEFLNLRELTFESWQRNERVVALIFRTR